MIGHPLPYGGRAGKSPRHPARFFIPLAVLAILIVVAAALLAGCGSAATTSPTASPPTTSTAKATYPVTVTDDDKNTVTIAKEPTRIVSTAPSNTEILFALGLGGRVVGVSSLDDYPPAAKAIAKVGDSQANTESVMGRAPDLVVGYSGNEEALAPIAKTGVPVLIFNPSSLAGIYANIDTIGRATGATLQAAALVAKMKAQVQAVVSTVAKTGTSPTVFYALDDTLWTAGPGSFVDELIHLAGGTNVADKNAGPATKAYFQLAAEQLVALNPDVVLLPETTFKSVAQFTGDPRFASLTAVKNGRVLLINDVIITRPGPRVAEGLKALAAAIHPEAF